MEECDYCGESFDDEDAYLRHLRDVHEGELGRIDRRRVAATESEGSRDLGPYAILFVVFVAAAVVAYVVFGIGGDGGGSTSGLPDSGDAQLLSDVQTFDSQGREHVDAGTEVDYSTSPPTSGPHYDGVAEPGFYEETPPLGELVHNLEHGHVVIYYDPAALDSGAEESLREFASTYTDTWAAVVVAPNPNADPESAYVLTAWEHMLRMDDYDEDVVRAFLAEYLGRGPENAVR